ncbi:MAG: hypothetical protein RIA08_09860 [Roseovarius sp.]|uniref:hypothetical protein n=1 Tax=Roseovarius sp. TaxID=1486281 RepID=UPI0032EC4F97
MTGSETMTAESKRARVRRLLIEPLIADGFRKRQKDGDEAHQHFLDRLADSVAYMSDDGLRGLRRCLSTKGEGSARHFWPCFATIIGHAEAFEKRPLAELPELLRWFASKAGPAALEAGRHVEEYEFWKKFKRPPTHPEDQHKVAEKAAQWQSKAQRVREEIQRLGKARWPQDRQWLDWYEAQGEYVRELIEGKAE